ncbi:hypothetical protein ACLMAL_00330 [Nocardia sp. CWNU-33]
MRELVDASNPLDAACRIMILEDQLAEAERINTDLQRALDDRSPGNPSAS